MQEGVATSVVLPVALALIMLGLGLALAPADFKRILTAPRAVLIGLAAQMVMLPVIAFLVATLFGLSPPFAVGIMLLAACPGGVTSNLVTHACRGDTALSVTLTASSSVAVLVTLPLVVSWSVGHFAGESQQVALPVAQTMGQLFLIAVLPIMIGMAVRRRAPGFATRAERPVRVASVVLFLLILTGLILANTELIRDNIASLGPAVLALNLATMAGGYALARAGGLARPQRISVMVEAGTQNAALAIVVATALLRRGELSIPAGLYALAMHTTAGLLIGWYAGRGRAAGRPAVAAP